jgi:xylan 1,4-beta-xylosidase
MSTPDHVKQPSCLLLFIASLTAILPATAKTNSAASTTATYRNPILDARGAADPTVIKFQGNYYLYPTLDGKGYDVFVSPDLVHWQRKPKCFSDIRGGLWAPDVFYDDTGSRQFYLYYTADNPEGGKLIGVAQAAHPLGPFHDKGTLTKGAIDAHLFKDDDRSLYLYYVQLTGGFKILAQPMKDPLRTTGEAKLMLHPTEPWEQKKGAVTEGPWILKRNQTYYLMYSGSGADGPDYSIGYATASSPLGPFTKYTGNPIAQRGNGVLGPGHHCVVEGPHGGLWMVYHQKESDRIGWDRFVALDPLWFDAKGIIHVKTTRGTEEAAP